MAMEYNPDTNTTRSTAPPPARKSMTWTYVALGVLLLAVAAMFAMPGNQAGDSTTSGAPPAVTDTLPPSAATDPVPPAATDPMPPSPATPN